MSILFATHSSQSILMPSQKDYVRNVGAASVCMWVNWNSADITGGQWRILSLGRGTNDNGSRINVGIAGGANSGKITCGGRALDTDALQTVTSTNVLATSGSRLHVCIVVDFSGRYFNIYTNGIYREQIAVAWTAGFCSNTADYNSHIAATPLADDQYFNGYIEDVRIYNRGLQTNEILSLCGCNGCDGIYYGMTFRALMNEGRAPNAATGAGTVKDFSSFKNDCTPVNSPLYNGTLLKTSPSII
jgi:Concanavalin A-like lectin/glucanases superfamily